MPRYSAVWAIVLVGAVGCEGNQLASPGPRAGVDAGTASPRDASATGPGTDAGSPPIEMDASVVSIDAGETPTVPPGPPAAMPPAPPPDRSAVVNALALERPDLLAGSCVAMGGSNEFLFEVVRRLRAEDTRWGLILRAGAVGQDLVGYHWGATASEGSTETYAVDIILRHCARAGVDAPAAPGWLDSTMAGDRWTLTGFDTTVPPPPRPDAGMTPPPPPGPPDGSDVVDAVARERPDLLAASCVDMGGNNEFLFEVVRRLRRIDPRWGLNWKRGNVGDMSQDAIDYWFGATGEPEGSTDVYIFDMIGGHCGATPGAAWIDVTEATRLGGTIGRWTLAGRTDI